MKVSERRGGMIFNISRQSGGVTTAIEIRDLEDLLAWIKKQDYEVDLNPYGTFPTLELIDDF